jgi:FkbM family methyltransferase
VEGFDPGTARRIAMTVSCPDADEIPKVADAGACRDQAGGRVQIMHNGLVVEEGGYYGEWMTETIRALRGHHEPQEELVFDQIVDRLRGGADSPVMIEFGSFWTYYGLWFCHALPSSRVVALEPDAPYLEVGRRNAALNGFTDRVTFFHAAIGSEPGRMFAFRAESDGRLHDVVQHDLPSLMLAANLEHVDLVLCDVQGAETVLLERAKDYLRDGRVRFLIVSTHHHSISGNALTHQNALELLMETGAHVIGEHTVAESFSGDGLIAVSFDARDKDFVVPVSYARSKDSLFGEVEVDLAAAIARQIEAEQGRIDAQARLAQLRTELGDLSTKQAAFAAELARLTAERDTLGAKAADLESDRDALRTELDAITGTKLWRWAKGPRTMYARIRGG